MSDFLNNNRPYDNSQPKAYLNWVLFDNQFKMVATNSGVVQVLPGSSKQALVAPLQSIVKNGYLYVYVSNESPQNVYFDDITVRHTSGPLLQEDAYYPYGVKLAGLCDKASLKTGNPYKYNGGSELEDEDGLEYYNTFYRKYDAQIGRFTGVDILAESTAGLTPYHFGANNPALYNDPTGLQHIPSYLDQYGNKWKTKGVLHGTSHAYTEFDWYKGYESAGGGPEGVGGGGSLRLIMSLFEKSGEGETGYKALYKQDKNGNWGVNFTWWEAFGAAEGSTLEGVISRQSFFAMAGEFASNLYFGRIDPAFVWINQNINPVTPIAEFVTGKEYTAQGFVNQKPRVNSAAESAIGFLPFGKVVGAGERMLVKNLAQTEFRSLSQLGLKDGMKVTSSNALDFGQQFLGKGYQELIPGSGRFVSADGTRVFRMGANDILGLHGGGPHVNFETLIPNPAKPGKMMVDLNYHIFLDP